MLLIIRWNSAFVLSPISTGLSSNPSIRLIVTISGNTAGNEQNTQVTTAVQPTSNVQATEISTPTRENPTPATPTTLHENTYLRADAEISVMEASTSVANVNTKLAQRMDQLSSNRIGVVTDANAGLVSILSNLEGIVRIADLLADVSISSLLACLNPELIQSNTYW